MPRYIVLILAVCLLLLASSEAATILNGNTLLNQGYANQLETWLNPGLGNQVIFNRIFVKWTGDGLTAANFHAAADGKGATISLMRVSNAGNQIIGGYNPFSWSTSGGYNYTNSGNAFIFNLNTTTKLNQNSNPYQTVMNSTYGPTFGGGHDIYVDNSLESGYAGYSHTYGAVLGGTYYNPAYYSYLEVYTVTVAPAVPEPTSMVLLGMAVVWVALRLRK